MAELAKECSAAGIKLGFYYSQDQDWHDANGAWNDWDALLYSPTREAGVCVLVKVIFIVRYGPSCKVRRPAAVDPKMPISASTTRAQ